MDAHAAATGDVPDDGISWHRLTALGVTHHEAVDALDSYALRSAHPVDEPRYWLTFWLADGTTLGRPYFVDTSELLGGVVLSREFRALLERYLSAD